MDPLKALILSLDDNEIRGFRSWERIFRSTKSDWPKRIELFDFLKADPSKSDTEASRHLYNQLPDTAYSHLKKNLYESLLNFLLLHESVPSEDASYNGQKKCWQLIANARLLMKRGLGESAISHLHQAKLLTDRYDLIYEKTIADEMLRSGFASAAGSDLYEGFSLEVKHNHDYMGKYLQALELTDRVLYPNSFFLMERDEYLTFTEDVLEILKGYWADTHSPRIRLMYHRVAAKFNELNDNLAAAVDSIRDALETMEEQSALNNRQLKKELQMQLLALLIKHNQIEPAIEVAVSMTTKLLPVHEDYFTFYNLMFRLHMITGDEDKAEQILNEAYSHIRIIRADEQLYFQWELNKAYLLWKRQKQYDCLGLIQKMMKQGGNSYPLQYSYRYLELICLLELQDIDKLVYRIETFRVFILKHKLHDTRRNDLIQKLMRHLVVNGVDFRACMAAHQHELTQLQETSGDMSWSPLSLELIRFDVWLTNYKNIRRQLISQPKFAKP